MSPESVHHYLWGCKLIYSSSVLLWELNFQFQTSPPVRRLTAFSLSPFYIAPLYFIAQFIASLPYSFWSSWSSKLLQLLLSVAGLVVTPLISWFSALSFSRAPLDSSRSNRSRSKLVGADLCPLGPPCNSLVLNTGQNLNLKLLLNTLLQHFDVIFQASKDKRSGRGERDKCYLSTCAALKLLKLLPIKLWHMISHYFPRHNKWEFSYLIWDT